MDGGIKEEPVPSSDRRHPLPRGNSPTTPDLRGRGRDQDLGRRPRVLLCVEPILIHIVVIVVGEQGVVGERKICTSLVGGG